MIRHVVGLGVFCLSAGAGTSIAGEKTMNQIINIGDHRDSTIATEGTARVVIVVAKDAPEPEQHAAYELSVFLEKVTGGKFRVVNIIIPGKDSLFVGPDAAKLADSSFSIKDLGAEGIILRTVNKGIILAGSRPRGTLYAVYTFLEDYVGCRWWSSKVSLIPRQPTLAVGDLSVRYVPSLEYRSVYGFDALNADWSAQNKCNGQGHRLQAKHGGKHSYAGFVHTIPKLVPEDRYGKSHPEWFKHGWLCLSNEDARRELVKNLKTLLRKHPEATIASVSQPDGKRHNCQCPKCKAVYKETGAPSGLVLRFVNAVAADIEKEFPHVAISTLAYNYTQRAPAKVVPRSNVIVRLCSMQASFSKPLNHDRNKAFRVDLIAWSKITDRLYVWDYTTNFGHYISPHPNLHVLGPNIRFMVKNGVKGIFEQGAYNSPGTEMAELRAWVLAKLLWNPQLDDRKLIDDFLDGYYGPAAPHIKAYLDVTHQAVDASGDYLSAIRGRSLPKFLGSFETITQSWKHLTAAEKAVQGKPDLILRVRIVQLPVLYVFMVNWKQFRKQAETAKIKWPVQDSVKEVHDHFIEVTKAAQIKRVREQSDLEWLKRYLHQ